MQELGSQDRARLAENLERLRARIARAAEAAGRDPAEVGLVTVTKYAGPAYARALLELGQRDLGENRVAHLLSLAEAIPAELEPRWHFIGHLQRNKANKVASLLHALHSLDSLALAEKLSERRDPSLPPLRVYLELRLSDEPGRSGGDEAELGELLAGARALTGLDVVGLMGLPPQGAPEDARPHFRRVRAAAERLGLEARSMGMTADLEVAIAEGATVVRVGRALLEGLSDEARS